jgi:hypothetical protein
MTRWLAALCASAAFAPLPAHALEVHGETDVFSGHGVALAWAVSRGPDEARTFIVVRVVTEPSIRAISVKGLDPFTKAEKTLVDARPTNGRLDIRIPRASFADFPSTRWMFHAGAYEAGLVVFYLGVPDTAPEFADQARLEAYLVERVKAVRSSPSPPSPRAKP